MRKLPDSVSRVAVMGKGDVTFDVKEVLVTVSREVADGNTREKTSTVNCPWVESEHGH